MLCPYSICLQAEHYFLWFCTKQGAKGSYGPIHTPTNISMYAVFHRAHSYTTTGQSQELPQSLKTKGVPQPCAASILDDARNMPDLNTVFRRNILCCLGLTLLQGQHPPRCLRVLGITAASPASRWPWFFPKGDRAFEEDGYMVTSGLNAARNHKATEHVFLAAQTLPWRPAMTVSVTNSTDSAAHLKLQIHTSFSML